MRNESVDRYSRSMVETNSTVSIYRSTKLAKFKRRVYFNEPQSATWDDGGGRGRYSRKVERCYITDRPFSILGFYGDRHQHFIKVRAEWSAPLAKTVYEMRFVRHIFVRSKHFARFTLFTRPSGRIRRTGGTKIRDRHVIF